MRLAGMERYQKYLAVFIIIGVVIIGGCAAVWIQGNSHLKAKQAEYAKVDTERKDVKALAEQLPGLEGQRAALDAEMSGIEQGMEQPEFEPRMLEQLRILSLNSGVELTNVQPAELKPAEIPKEEKPTEKAGTKPAEGTGAAGTPPAAPAITPGQLNVTITVEGPYDNLREFLRGLQDPAAWVAERAGETGWKGVLMQVNQMNVQMKGRPEEEVGPTTLMVQIRATAFLVPSLATVSTTLEGGAA